jgi:hypothetical protein
MGLWFALTRFLAIAKLQPWIMYSSNSSAWASSQFKSLQYVQYGRWVFDRKSRPHLWQLYMNSPFVHFSHHPVDSNKRTANSPQWGQSKDSCSLSKPPADISRVGHSYRLLNGIGQIEVSSVYIGASVNYRGFDTTPVTNHDVCSTGECFVSYTPGTCS